MALFYNQADQDIYTGGDHFIPQEQYRLGNFNPASPSIANASNTGGLTTIPQGGPYMGYPSYAAYLAAQPGGGGGGAGDEDDGGYAGLGMSPGALGGKLSGFGNWGKRAWGNIKDAYSNVPSITKGLAWGFNKISELNEARKAKKEQELQAEIDAHNYHAGISIRDHAGTGGIGSPESQQGGAPGTSKGEAGFKGAYGGIVGLAQGGRIGFNKGGNYAQNAIANQLFGSSFDVLDPFQQDQIDSLISQVGTTSLGTLKAQGGRVPFFYGGLASIL